MSFRPATKDRMLNILVAIRDDLSARAQLSQEPDVVELSSSIWNRLCQVILDAQGEVEAMKVAHGKTSTKKNEEA